jgi:hypothetical protein
MALYGGLAENIRRNERADRGILTIAPAANGVGWVTCDPTVNASVLIIAPAYGGLGGMRVFTHFVLTVDDLNVPGDGVTVTKPIDCTGNINTANRTVNSIVYKPGTLLTINLYVATSSANPTAIQTGVGGTVRWQVWGNLLGQVDTNAHSLSSSPSF